MDVLGTLAGSRVCWRLSDRLPVGDAVVLVAGALKLLAVSRGLELRRDLERVIAGAVVGEAGVFQEVWLGEVTAEPASSFEALEEVRHGA